MMAALFTILLKKVILKLFEFKTLTGRFYFPIIAMLNFGCYSISISF